MTNYILTEKQEAELMTSVRDGGDTFDIIFIGGGVAALSGAIYASRDGFKTLVLEGSIISSTDAPGGALLLTNEIENFPGFPAGSGQDLIETIRSQALNFGATIIEERVEEFLPNMKHGCCHQVRTDEGNIFKGRAIIFAMGANARLLGVPNEEKFLGRGVSTCGTCDAFMFKDKRVVLVGGGDTACEDVLLLTKYAKHVTMIVRGDKLRSTGPEARIIADHPEVTILYKTKLEKIISNEDDTKITKVIIEGQTSGEIKTEGVFIAIGSDPSTTFLKSHPLITLDSDGYIKTINGLTRIDTPIPGLYAAGDVTDKIYRQAVTSAGKGVQAALEARSYLNNPVP